MGNFKSNKNSGRGKRRFSGSRSFGGGFGRSRGGSRFGGRGEGSFQRGQKYDAICSKCKKKCRVPFKPTGNKPVLCSDCFKDNNSGGAGNGEMSSEQFKQINEKLDKIILFLENLNKKDKDSDK